MKNCALKNGNGDFISDIIVSTDEFRYGLIRQVQTNVQIVHTRYLIHAMRFTDAEALDIIDKHPQTYVRVNI